MEIVVRFIEAIIWPALVFWVLFYFRAPLKAFLEKLSYINAWGIQAGIDKEIDLAEEKVREARKRLGKSIAEHEQEASPFRDIEKLSWLANVAPRAAIVEAWVAVEDAIAVAAKKSSLAEPERRIPRKLIMDIGRLGYIDEGALDAYRQLQKIRNDAVHSLDQNVNSESALRYLEIAAALIRVLDKVGEQNI